MDIEKHEDLRSVDDIHGYHGDVCGVSAGARVARLKAGVIGVEYSCWGPSPDGEFDGTNSTPPIITKTHPP